MPDYDDDVQNAYYRDGILSQDQIAAIENAVNADTLWDDPDLIELDDDLLFDEDDF